MKKNSQKKETKKSTLRKTDHKSKNKKSSNKFSPKVLLLVILLIAAIFCILAYIFVNKKKEKITDEVNEIINADETSSQVIPSYQTIPSGTYFDIMSKRATMEVNFKDGEYYFEVNWANSASENMRWVFSGKYDKFSRVIPYDNAKCIYGIYDEEGNADESVIFDNGKGIMKHDDNKLYWDDNNSDKAIDAHYNGIFEIPKDIK